MLFVSRDNVIKVVVAGNAPSVKGGITSVISQIMSHEWEAQGIVMKHITTFSGGNAVNKIMTFIKGYNQIKKECKSGGVDVVHIHMSHNGSFDRKFLIHKLCKKYGIPDIIHLHSSEFVKFYEKSPDSKKKKIRSLLSECSCVIALGKEWEQRVKRIAPDAKIRIMNNTVHIPEHCTEQPEDKIGFLYMGVLVK